jgi:hypothetical protein
VFNPARKLGTIAQKVRERGFKQALRRLQARIDKVDLVQFGIRGLLLPFKVEHVSGAKHISYGLNELVVICVVRNGALHIKSFLNHYRSLGVRHFVFLDNESEDGTLGILTSAGDNVTVLRTSAPYQAYENTMKRFLARRFCSGRWCLCADIDELFDFPYSTRMPLNELLRYLNHYRYNSVITQMLDMFSDTPLMLLRSTPDDDIRSTYRHYDISAVRRSPYMFPVPDARIQMHRGGIRKKLFGTDNGLTKISLFRMDGELKPFLLWHHARNAKIADVSCVLLHYPFVSSFASKVHEAVKSGRYGFFTSDEYSAYSHALSRNPGLQLLTETAATLASVDDLIESEFIVVSDHYRKWSIVDR